MAGATASLVLHSTRAEDSHEVFISVPSSSDAAQGHHGNTSSTATSQHVSSGYADYSLATGHLDLPKVQKQSPN